MTAPILELRRLLHANGGVEAIERSPGERLELAGALRTVLSVLGPVRVEGEIELNPLIGVSAYCGTRVAYGDRVVVALARLAHAICEASS